MNFIKKHKVLFLIFLFLVLVIGILCIFCVPRNKSIKIIGTVIDSGNGYYIIESEEEDYILEEGEYEIGSVLEIEILESDIDSMPIFIQKSNVEVIEKAINQDSFMNGSLEITADTPEKEENKGQNSNLGANQDGSSNEEEIVSDGSEIIYEEPEEITSKDELVMAYFADTEQSLNANNDEKVKQAFITTIDFLFYDGEIKGVRLEEVTTKTKLFVLKYALKLDSWIDSKFPNYKETISTTSKRVYTSAKTKIVSLYLDTTAKICKSNSSLCTDAKNDFQSMKTSFGITWDLIKSLASTGTTKLREWYEIWSNK